MCVSIAVIVLSFVYCLNRNGQYGKINIAMKTYHTFSPQKCFETLQRVTSFISQISNLHKLLNLIMEESKSILNAEASSLLLYNKNEKVLYFEVATGEKGSKVKKIKLKLGQGIAGMCAKEKEIINVEDVTKDKRWYRQADKKSAFRTRSILAMPIIRKRKLIGVLEVLNKRSGKPFDKEDIELMKIIASEAGLAIENAYLYSESLVNAKLAAAGQTMLSLSHDIKNILNGLLGGLSLVDEGFQSKTTDYVDTGWGMVKKNVERISELILDMLDFSSKKKPLYQKVNIRDFVRETANIYQDKMQEKNCSFEYEFDEKLNEVEIDFQGMHRALLNLVSNAYDVIPEKKGIIFLQAKLLSPGKKFQITIRDNGPGIAPENLKKLFELFFTTKGHKGTGLGLAVVNKIVQEHKGKIDVNSKVGEGTVFTITLPVGSG